MWRIGETLLRVCATGSGCGCGCGCGCGGLERRSSACVLLGLDVDVDVDVDVEDWRDAPPRVCYWVWMWMWMWMWMWRIGETLLRVWTFRGGRRRGFVDRCPSWLRTKSGGEVGFERSVAMMVVEMKMISTTTS